MYPALVSCLILSAAPASTNASHHPDAREMFQCGFEKEWDTNHDTFPDGWSRRRDAEFPHYLKVAIVEGAAHTGRATLRMELDGGAASVFSPPIEVGPEFSYVLECRLKTEQLVHDVAFMTLAFFDVQQKRLATFTSDRLGTAADWTKLSIGPVAPPKGDVAFAVIGLHLHPTRRFDIRGAAIFDDVWLAHLPRMNVETNSPHNILLEKQNVTIACRASGILERDPMVTFELVDVAGQAIDQASLQMDGQAVQRKAAKALNLPGLRRTTATGYAGRTEWSPKTMTPGFYRVRVTMKGAAGLMQQREVTFAVIRQDKQRVSGEFGWSLPRGDQPLGLTALDELLGHAAVSWVKFPVWHDAGDIERGGQLTRFAERLHNRGITLVGLLDQPPEDVRTQIGDSKGLFAANIFTSDPEIWYRSLEPVMTRLSSRVNWWQLGLDSDTSFVGYPNVVATIKAIKDQLGKVGLDARLGMSWRWTSEIHSGKDVPFEFLAMSAEPPLQGGELAEYLAATKSSPAKRWVVLEPLARDQYPLETRATDLVERMMAAKIGGADAIFVPEPFSTDRGLMNDDGTPGELFMTWRTAASALNGAKYLGQLELKNGSKNRIFSRGRDAVMVIWNERPVQETVYLGKVVEQTDLWGRVRQVPVQARGHVIDVGPLPTFLTGVSEAIVRLSMTFALTETKLPSVFGKPHRTALTMTNFFPQGVGGNVTVHLPAAWRKPALRFDVKMAAGEELVQPFDIVLPPDASSGPQEVQFDFKLSVDEQYEFSLFRKIEVGLGDIVIHVTSALSPEGVLIVKQEMTNNTDRFVDFKCYLSAPGRRRMQNQVYRLGRGTDVKFYRFGNGRDLLGKTLQLKAEEIDGPRSFNYTLTATE